MRAGIGRLPETDDLSSEFAARVARASDAPGVQMVGDLERRVERVAIVCGAGDDFLGDAARAGADVLLTGEARFHRASRPKRSGSAWSSPATTPPNGPGVEDLAERIAGAFPALTVWPSRQERDPLRPIGLVRLESQRCRARAKKNPRERPGGSRKVRE